MAPSRPILSAPRVLDVDLATGAAHLGSLRCDDPELAALGRASGPALGLALIAQATRAGSEPPFVVCVGAAVRAGLATAARASVLARVPLTGRVGEGQIGGELGRRLASVADALVLRGRAPGQECVVCVGADGRVERITHGAGAGASAAAVARDVLARRGPCALLATGPAAGAGVLFANLAGYSPDGSPPSYVGRGGLGAVLARHGVRAIAVEGEPVPEAEGDATELAALLVRSPRLRGRARGGTFELAPALAARGELFERAGESAVDVDEATRRMAQLAGTAAGRHGCRGCPTPCGWVFETDAGERAGARFGALEALGANVGLAHPTAGRKLLDAANAVGVDAKEAGACLALLCRAGRLEWGAEAALLARLEGLGQAARTDEERAFCRGARALAAELDLAEVHAPHDAGGEAARPGESFVARLAARVGARGADPMRTFPFLLEGGADRATMERLVAPRELPAGAEDPEDAAGKALLIAWHEDLSAAIDASGFCAFSAAGLLADGVLGVDELAGAIGPQGARDGASFLALGARLVGLHAELAREWGTSAEDPALAPDLARDTRTARVLNEHRALRSAQVMDAAPARRAPRPAPDSPASPDSPGTPGTPGTPGQRPDPGRARVLLCSSGVLAERLGARLEFEGELPATLMQLLSAVARERPGARALLFDGAALLPAVYRERRRVVPSDLVHAGERLDLVLVVSGG